MQYTQVCVCVCICLIFQVSQLQSEITKDQSTRLAQVTGLLSHRCCKQTNILFLRPCIHFSLKLIFTYLDAQRVKRRGVTHQHRHTHQHTHTNTNTHYPYRARKIANTRTQVVLPIVSLFWPSFDSFFINSFFFFFYLFISIVYELYMHVLKFMKVSTSIPLAERTNNRVLKCPKPELPPSSLREMEDY